MTTGEGFDVEATFDEDYLYFYEPRLTERADAEVEVICRLGPVQPGDRVLDLACGHGRIANRLAARGAAVTGYDLTERFLVEARGAAAEAGVEVTYVQGDMRDLDYDEDFDVVINWFTAFGYYEDETDREVLRRVARSLRAGGRLLLEINHAPALWAGFLPSFVTRKGDDMAVDEHRYDPLTGRMLVIRTVIREGRIRTFQFVTRQFAYPELSQWLLAAGFARVAGFDGHGGELSQESRRMILRAVK